MASFTFEGLDELTDIMEQLAKLPDNVARGMLEAEAKVVIKAQKDAAPKDTGTLADSITGAPMKSGGSGRYKYIYPKGVNHKYTSRSGSKEGTKKRYRLKAGESRDVRNAEVAFIHEFGAEGRNIPARQWMEKANESAADEAVDAAAAVYDEWLNSL